jgi:selenocysteine-specific elongation factor
MNAADTLANREDHFDLILGTAGHIDHGKTSLIKALTGVDTDRLPEEKKRGITIELGYAHLEIPPFRLGIVDVPGHEKFVRQMLAGATGMNLALLVIAADDSIKQQTIEHLDILKLLNLSGGVIALTKSDLLDPDWLELVEAEITQLVEGTFLEQAPIIRTSAKTGQGLEELKQALLEASHQVRDKLLDAESCQPASSLTYPFPASSFPLADDHPPAQDAAASAAPAAEAVDPGLSLPEPTRQASTGEPFRLAIDRAFSIAGHGTVVTGSVSSGRLQVGDSVEIQPGGQIARVRGLQNHDSKVDWISRGQRGAINLAGVSLADIERGYELATPGHLVPSTLLTVQLKVLERASRELKNRAGIRFHIGTAEVPGIVRLLDALELKPGQSGLAQIQLTEPVVASWRQPFVIRQPSPVETLGGGLVLHPNSLLLKRPSELEQTLLPDLANDDPLRRSAAAVFFSNSPQWHPRELHRTAGITDPRQVFEKLKASGSIVEIPISASRNLTVHHRRIDLIGERVLKALAKLHEKFPLRFSHPRNALNHEFDYLQQPRILDLAIEQLKQQKLVTANVNSIALVGSGPKLSKGQKQLLDQLIQQFKEKGLLAPSVADLEAGASKNKDSVVELLNLAAENGDLVKISSDIYLHQQTLEQVTAKLQAAFETGNGLTISEIRQVLDTTRKYAIPLCEYYDQIGFTARDGDVRRLKTSGTLPAAPLTQTSSESVS